MSREYDIIIFGATGFTGTLACEYMEANLLLAKQNEQPKRDKRVYQLNKEFQHVQTGYAKKVGDVKWAIGGRDRAKLDKMKEKLTTCSGVVIADSSNLSSIDEMVRATKVILSFAGPFSLYGTPVVESCVKWGTHYCDSTGEMAWVQDMMKRFHTSAVSNHALIIPMCGFDCIPSDLGVLYAVQKLRERGSVSIRSAKTYASMIGGMSGGTLATGILMETKYKHISDDPFNLGGGPESDEHLKQALNNQKDAKFDSNVHRWTGPFVMESLNTRVVRRSAFDLKYRSPGKGGFHYSECAIAPDETSAKKLAMGSAPPEKRKQLVEQGKLPKPGEGPSFAFMRKAWFQLLINAQDEENKQIWVSVSGGDAGYEDTSLMCCESALCLALEYDALPQQGGVFTPGIAFGTTLIERLDRAGMRFRVTGHPQAALRSSL